ncbi:DnaJ domain-containing protein [Artemisia annua]|uniref:DnaJ domain-containing protein n=1 Tax=Artemisia annua TaxID=35608 RepID=A0A2U1QFH5_ARTAN|nr:DnaJ domain-containing protein [Artemisia annua]
MPAISIASASSCSLFASTFNTHKSTSQALPTSLKFKKTSISAAYATTERTSTETSFCSTTPSSLYDVLGLRMGADTREVKAVYRKLAIIVQYDSYYQTKRDDIHDGNLKDTILLFLTSIYMG